MGYTRILGGIVALSALGWLVLTPRLVLVLVVAPVFATCGTELARRMGWTRSGGRLRDGLLDALAAGIWVAALASAAIGLTWVAELPEWAAAAASWLLGVGWLWTRQGDPEDLIHPTDADLAEREALFHEATRPSPVAVHDALPADPQGRTRCVRRFLIDSLAYGSSAWLVCGVVAYHAPANDPWVLALVFPLLAFAAWLSSVRLEVVAALPIPARTLFAWHLLIPIVLVVLSGALGTWTAWSG